MTWWINTIANCAVEGMSKAAACATLGSIRLLPGGDSGGVAQQARDAADFFTPTPFGDSMTEQQHPSTRRALFRGLAPPALDPPLGWHVLGLTLLMLLLGLFYQQLNPWLEFDRQAIAAGQWWRLISAHLVHSNLWHLGMNLIGLVLCWYFFADLLTRSRLWLWLVVSILLVSAAFWWRDSQLQHYVGLSGILHGLLVMCLLLGWRGNPWLHSLVLAIIVTRLILEQQPDYDVNYLRQRIDAAVYVNAHLYGALAGALIGGGLLVWQRINNGRKQQKNAPG